MIYLQRVAQQYRNNVFIIHVLSAITIFQKRLRTKSLLLDLGDPSRSPLSTRIPSIDRFYVINKPLGPDAQVV